jgi:hypothetical protein
VKHAEAFLSRGPGGVLLPCVAPSIDPVAICASLRWIDCSTSVAAASAHSAVVHVDPHNSLPTYTIGTPSHHWPLAITGISIPIPFPLTFPIPSNPFIPLH